MPKVLFIVKRRDDPSLPAKDGIGIPTGLYNSAKFMNDMLVSQGIDSYLEVVADSEDIDLEVDKHLPSHVIIEALWVVPIRFVSLQQKYPNIKWVIRTHSEVSFMAGEGIAMDWIADYSGFKNVTIACNAPRMLRELRLYLQQRNRWSSEEINQKVVFLPNYYPQEYKTKVYEPDKDFINIGCFGAIRPLKNHLLQAMAAIEFADKIGRKLRFHVNAGRIEMKGDTVTHNLKSMFEQLSHTGHQMIDHEWSGRHEFLELCSSMDIGMQISFSETFNIVAADLVSQGVPIVASREIPWIDLKSCADPTNSISMVKTLFKTHKSPFANVAANKESLTKYITESASVWSKYVK